MSGVFNNYGCNRIKGLIGIEFKGDNNYDSLKYKISTRLEVQYIKMNPFTITKIKGNETVR
jgi:hypothetical protein